MGDVLGRLIAFDLDGTLVDSARDLADSVNDLLVELGAPGLPSQTITRMVGEGARVLVKRALDASGIAGPPDVLARFLAIYDTRLLEHTRPYAGIVDVVQAARGHARLAVLTNKPLQPSEKILAGLGIRDLFDDVIGSDGPYPRKPDPAALRALMERASATPARTLMIGDSIVDYETARAASVRCCLVGYGFSTHTLESVPAGDALMVQDVAGLAHAIDAFVAEE